MYGFDTYDHATCVHLHCPLDMKRSTCLQLVSTMISIGAISCATKMSHVIIIVLFFCDWCSIVILMIFHYITIHNIMLTYMHIKPYDFMEGESLYLNWNQKQRVYYIKHSIRVYIWICLYIPQCIVFKFMFIISYFIMIFLLIINMYYI